jgi:hypothetical protein
MYMINNHYIYLFQNTASPFITTPHGNPNFNPVKVRGGGVRLYI